MVAKLSILYKQRQYCQQSMLNFNNKKVTPHHQLLNPSLLISKQSEAHPDSTPTEYLLLISQMEHLDKINQSSRYQMPEQVEVTPWVNMPFRIKKDKGGNKSKTSTLLTSYEDYRGLCSRDKTDGQNRTSIPNKGSRRQLKFIQKNLDSSKNIQSAIARYSHRNNEKDINNDEPSINPEKPNNPYLKTYNSSNQVTKISSVQKKCSKAKNNQHKNNQQNDSHFSVFDLSKFEQNLKSRKNFLNCTEYRISNSGSILKQNTAIVNQAKPVSLFSCQQHSGLDDTNNNKFNLLHEHDDVEKLKKKVQDKTEMSIFRKAQFQNILTDAHKKSSEYQKIKAKILENIQKESIIKEGTMKVDINKSKKMLGRYFKQIQEKKPKKKLKIYPHTTQKTDISETSLDGTNPFTKHLYDKYKLLLNKPK